MARFRRPPVRARHVPSRRQASTISPSISGSATHAGSSASEAIPVTT